MHSQNAPKRKRGGGGGAWRCANGQARCYFDEKRHVLQEEGALGTDRHHRDLPARVERAQRSQNIHDALLASRPHSPLESWSTTVPLPGNLNRGPRRPSQANCLQ